MQIKDSKEYDRQRHDRFKALSVHNPFATWISKGIKTFEIRSKPIIYRGDIMICSTQLPQIEDMVSGAMICKVEVYDCLKVKDLTEEQWLYACLPKEKQFELRNHYAWALRNPRRVIELPVSGNQGLWSLIFPKGEIIEYPIEINRLIQFESSRKKANSIIKARILRSIAILTSIILAVIALVFLVN